VAISLRELNLPRSNITASGAAELAKALVSNCTLKAVCRTCGSRCERVWAQTVHKASPLLSLGIHYAQLVLEGNQLADVGSAQLAKALVVNRGLTKVSSRGQMPLLEPL